MELEQSVLLGLIELEEDRRLGERILCSLETGRKDWGGLTSGEKRLAMGVALLERLLSRTFALRFKDPAEMVSLSEAACALSEQLPDERYGAQVVNDLRARSWAERGNALRVVGDLHLAGAAFSRAIELAVEGTASLALLTRLVDLLASHLTDLRRFEEAMVLLQWLENLYSGRNDREALAKTLVQIGHVQTQAHEPDVAISVYRRVLELLEPGDPLRLFVVHSLALNWLEVGEHESARRLVEQNRRLYRRSGKLNKFRLLWLEGKIALALGDSRKAEGKLQTARLALLRAGKSYESSLVALDVALVLARQDRRKELMLLVSQMVATFRNLGIGRETIATLLLLQKSCEELRSKDILCGQIEALARVLPELRPRSRPAPKPPE